MRNLIVLFITFALRLEPLLAESPPTKEGALLKWLQAGAYIESFTPEPAIRESFTAHGTYVRTWYNRRLVEDLRAGRRVFRKGAVMVKELYGDSTGQPQGWALMRKTMSSKRKNGNAWLFYEKLPGGLTFLGPGLSTCTGCHKVGTDFLLSPFRP